VVAAALACTPTSRGSDLLPPPPLQLELAGSNAGGVVPAGDYVWIGRYQAVLMTDVPLGQRTAGTRQGVVDLDDGRVPETSLAGSPYLVQPFFEGLYEIYERRKSHTREQDLTPLVFVVDDRIPAQTFWQLLWTAERAERSRVFLFSGTAAEPRAVAVVNPSRDEAKGGTLFEADLSLLLRDGNLFPIGRPREAGIRLDRGYPTYAALDLSGLPIDVDGNGQCSIAWPLEDGTLERIQSELCDLSQGRPHVLALEVLPAALSTGDLVKLLVTDLRPRSCGGPIGLLRPDSGTLDTSCARAAKVKDLPAAFAAAVVREPG
jgi:hypothetical protein